MRVPKLAIVLVAILGLLLAFIIWRSDSNLRKFERKGARYHADLAVACDSILAHYPLGTNEAVELAVESLRLPESYFRQVHPSMVGVITNQVWLPEIVRQLHPLKIEVATNRVWILVNYSVMNGLVIAWEPQDETQTKVWHLEANNGGGGRKVVYVKTR